MSDGREGWVEFGMIERQLGRDAALNALKQLHQRDVIEEREENGRLEYRFKIELSRLWVTKNRPLTRVLLELGRERSS